MQLVPHLAKPVLHENPQAPALHVGLAFSGTIQAASHAPQWLVFVCRSTQAAPHCSRPAAQVVLQLPTEQTRPIGHATAQLPQCCGSLWTSTQSPEHSW
jgi:hypothetical protein